MYVYIYRQTKRGVRYLIKKKKVPIFHIFHLHVLYICRCRCVSLYLHSTYKKDIHFHIVFNTFGQGNNIKLSLPHIYSLYLYVIHISPFFFSFVNVYSRIYLPKYIPEFSISFFSLNIYCIHTQIYCS